MTRAANSGLFFFYSTVLVYVAVAQIIYTSRHVTEAARTMLPVASSLTKVMQMLAVDYTDGYRNLFLTDRDRHQFHMGFGAAIPEERVSRRSAQRHRRLLHQ